jgi:hypothetical protein
VSVANAFFAGMANPYAIPAAANQPPRQHSAPAPFEWTPAAIAKLTGGYAAEGASMPNSGAVQFARPGEIDVRKRALRWLQPFVGQGEPNGPFHIPNEPLQPIGS